MEAIAGAIITDICDAHLGILDSAQETSDATVRATKLFSDITGGNNYVSELADSSGIVLIAEISLLRLSLSRILGFVQQQQSFKLR